jgi:acetylornithine deacetylase/succinyl-diaminopimelate desuccinylase-like protein
VHQPGDTISQCSVKKRRATIGRVLFTIDFRHPDREVLARLGDQVAAVCREHARGCGVDVVETLNSPPTDFDHRICELIRAAAERQGLSHMPIVSGATHDAKYMARLCPTGMIFVPCEGGISHNEAERASAADLAAGARVLPRSCCGWTGLEPLVGSSAVVAQPARPGHLDKCSGYSRIRKP